MAEKIYYKYKKFNETLLSNLLNETIYFASPDQLNDPFESLSYLDMDISTSEAEDLFNRLSLTMSPEKHHERSLKTIINDSDYHFHTQEGNLTRKEIYESILKTSIEKMLREKYNKGVFSLSEKYDCPLLWSHYGDEHKGICIGYSIPLNTMSSLFKVEYSNDKSVKASDLLKMTNQNRAAQRRVDKTVLQKKSKHWSYEKEWRLIGEKGLSSLTIEIKEIIFGIKCSGNIKEMIVRILNDGVRKINYFEMKHEGRIFSLKRNAYDEYAEILKDPPNSLQNARNIQKAFSPIP
jgi:hypothetical protein